MVLFNLLLCFKCDVPGPIVIHLLGPLGVVFSDLSSFLSETLLILKAVLGVGVVPRVVLWDI